MKPTVPSCSPCWPAVRLEGNGITFISVLRPLPECCRLPRCLPHCCQRCYCCTPGAGGCAATSAASLLPAPAVRRSQAQMKHKWGDMRHLKPEDILQPAEGVTADITSALAPHLIIWFYTGSCHALYDLVAPITHNTRLTQSCGHVISRFRVEPSSIGRSEHSMLAPFVILCPHADAQ